MNNITIIMFVVSNIAPALKSGPAKTRQAQLLFPCIHVHPNMDGHNCQDVDFHKVCKQVYLTIMSTINPFSQCGSLEVVPFI